MAEGLLLRNLRLATMAGPAIAGEEALGVIDDGALVVQGGALTFVGALRDLPPQYLQLKDVDLQGRWVTPGLIDCHTHLVYAGDRAHEWQQRLEGKSYADIAAQGGGIASSVAATRAASEDQLYEATKSRLQNWLAEGVTTVEIKSGYGLRLEDEVKMLRAARRVGAALPLRVRTTFLGAHALPEEFLGRPDAYIEYVIEQMLPAVASGLADALDVFCEKIAFSVAQTERLFEAAGRYGMPVKVHADQLANSGGSSIAARYQALSADHLEYTPAESIKAMASAKVVAVLLPAAFYCMREKQLPPVAEMRAANTMIAIATDHNPGTSPCSSLLLAMNMACTLFRMTPAEALLGVTRHAATALGLASQVGQLKAGHVADLAVWDVTHVRDLCYGFGVRPLAASMFAGAWVEPGSTARAPGF